MIMLDLMSSRKKILTINLLRCSIMILKILFQNCGSNFQHLYDQLIDSYPNCFLVIDSYKI